MLKVLAALAIGVPAFVIPQISEKLVHIARAGSGAERAAVAGLVLGVVVQCAMRVSRRFEFDFTYQHERAHSTVARLLGARVLGFVASSTGNGKVVRSGIRSAGLRSFLVTIAPYVFSPIMWTPILIWLARPGDEGWLWPLAAGTVAGFAIALAAGEFDLRQPDLRRHGRIVSALSALWIWAGISVVVVASSIERSLWGLPETYRAGFEVAASIASVSAREVLRQLS
jgi:hypothetical protein